MRVEVWSDYMCPMCYLNKRRLERALEGFPSADEIEVVLRSYELDPQADTHLDVDYAEFLVAAYGMMPEDSADYVAQVTAMGADVGLEYRFERMTPTNSFDAHRLTHLAAAEGKAADFAEIVYRGYFSEARDISDEAFLLDAAVRAGLDRAQVAEILAGDRFADEVRADEEEAASWGAERPPFIVFDEEGGFQGPLSVEDYGALLSQYT